MARKILALLICIPALFMPHKMRILFSEALGWAVQLIYMMFFRLLSFIIKELSKEEARKDA